MREGSGPIARHRLHRHNLRRGAFVKVDTFVRVLCVRRPLCARTTCCGGVARRSSRQRDDSWSRKLAGKKLHRRRPQWALGTGAPPSRRHACHCGRIETCHAPPHVSGQRPELPGTRGHRLGEGRLDPILRAKLRAYITPVAADAASRSQTCRTAGVPGPRLVPTPHCAPQDLPLSRRADWPVPPLPPPAPR
jgi:hypothetical protein